MYFRFFAFIVVTLIMWSTEGVTSLRESSLSESTWAKMVSLLGTLTYITGAIVGLGVIVVSKERCWWSCLHDVLTKCGVYHRPGYFSL